MISFTEDNCHPKWNFNKFIRFERSKPSLKIEIEIKSRLKLNKKEMERSIKIINLNKLQDLIQTLCNKSYRNQINFFHLSSRFNIHQTIFSHKFDFCCRKLTACTIEKVSERKGGDVTANSMTCRHLDSGEGVVISTMYVCMYVCMYICADQKNYLKIHMNITI